MHTMVEELSALKSGSLIAYRRYGRTRAVIFVRETCGMLVVKSLEEEILVAYSEYLYTIYTTKDLLSKLSEIQKLIDLHLVDNEHLNSTVTLLACEVWTRCEQHYGIDAEGSKSSDVRRTVAFLILKGDRPALDVATDLLGG